MLRLSLLKHCPYLSFPILQSLFQLQSLLFLHPLDHHFSLQRALLAPCAILLLRTAAFLADNWRIVVGCEGNIGQIDALFFHYIFGDQNIDVMQRLEQVNGHLQMSNDHHNLIATLMWERRNRIIQAFEPHLTDFARELVRKEYRNILRKIVEARSIFKEKFKLIERDSYTNQSVDLLSLKIWEEFRRCLEDKLYEIVSSLLNQLTDKLARKISKIPEKNLIARSVRIYSSVMGSYQLKLTFLQRLSPNIRTLSYIEKEMMQRSGDRQLSGSIWVLLYIFSFAFVQMFGKYITRHEKGEVLRIIKATFVRNLALVAGSIQLQPSQLCQTRHELETRLDEWIQEISKSVQ